MKTDFQRFKEKMGKILWPETGEAKEFSPLNTQFWETDHEGEGEAAKETVLAAQEKRRRFKGVIYKEWKDQHVTINK